jgi:signal transduction histidine kinase
LKRANWAYWIRACSIRLLTLLALLQGSESWATPGQEYVVIGSAQVEYFTDSQLQPSRSSMVSLPHRFDKEFQGDIGWMRYQIDLDARSSLSDLRPNAIFIPRVGNQVEVSLVVADKTYQLLQLGKLGDPSTDSAKSPVWILIPAGLLPQSAQKTEAPLMAYLEIKISAQHSRYGGLSKVYIGPVDKVKPLFDRDYLWRNTSSVIVVVALGLMGFVALGIWRQQRDPIFGIFAGAALLGMLRMSDRIIFTPPLNWPLWGGVTAFAYAAHLLLLCVLALQVANRWTSSVKWVFAAIFFLAFASSMSAFLFNLPSLWSATLLGLMLPGLLALCAMLVSYYKQKSRETLAILLATVVVLVFGIRDFVLVRLAKSTELTYSLLPHALFFLVLAMAWVVVERYAKQMRLYRDLNQSLEDRVSSRETELASSYQRLRVQDQNKAKLEERARIMRDIHDGVGAQLVGLISALRRRKETSKNSEHDQDLNLASAALDELRMAVDALQPVEGDLATVLATLRYRLQPRLTEAGIEVVWNVEELPFQDNLTPIAVLEVQRILLEAVTNILKHAKATRIVVGGHLYSGRLNEPDFVQLSVEDNGVGIDNVTGTISRGQGLNNMQTRARAIGAVLFVGRGSASVQPVGTKLTLKWPLQKQIKGK